MSSQFIKSSSVLENLKLQTDIYDSLVQQTLIDEIDSGARITDVIDAIVTIDTKRREIQYGARQRLKLEAASKFEWDDHRRADGVPILSKKNTNTTKINHKSHTSFDRTIVKNKASYFTGKPVKLAQEGSFFEDWLKRNKWDDLLMFMSKDATSMGEGFTLLYSPQGSNEAFMSREQPYTCVNLYDQDTGFPKYGLIYAPDLTEDSTTDTKTNTEAGQDLIVFWYTMTTVTGYKGTQETLRIVEEETPHLFAGVPLIEWKNNEERISDIEPVLGLMDLYDIMDSDFLSELSQLRLAYFLLKGFGLSTGQETVGNNPGDTFPVIPGFEEVLASKTFISLVEEMTKAGVFLTDNPDAEASFINKTIAFDAVKYAKDNLRFRIFQNGSSYDPTSFMDGNAGNITAFQIERMLFPLEQAAQETEVSFKYSISYMIKLLMDFYNRFSSDEIIPVEEVVFRRNLPENILADLKEARTAGFNISQKQLARRMPFEIDQEENEKELAEERESALEVTGFMGMRPDEEQNTQEDEEIEQEETGVVDGSGETE